MTTPSDDTTIRKAAILVSVLSPPEADRLLDRFPGDLAQRLRDAMIDLDDVDPAEERRVLDEFLRLGGGGTVPFGPPGFAVEDSPPADVVRQQRDNPRRRPTLPEDEPDESAEPPFRFLQETEAERLSRILAGERPQTVAVVLAHLSPQQAGAVLVRMEPSLQVEIVHRLIELEEADPVVLREVERVLHARLSQQVQMQRRRVAGMQAVAGILQAAPRDVGTQLLDNLAARDRRLAEKLGPQPLSFDDLARAGDRLWRQVLDEADPELMWLALIGAREELLDRVFRLLPAEESASWRARLENPGPIRLRDVELARRELAALATRCAGPSSLGPGTVPFGGPAEPLRAAA